jgi:hypothetical protein
MSAVSKLDGLKMVKGPSLKERFEQWVKAQHREPMVAQLKRFREDLQADMGNESWLELRGPAYLFLADTCRALDFSDAETAQVLGEAGTAALQAAIEQRYTVIA